MNNSQNLGFSNENLKKLLKGENENSLMFFPWTSFEKIYKEILNSTSFKSPSKFTLVIALIHRPPPSSVLPPSSLPIFLEDFSVLTETLYMHSFLFLFWEIHFNIPHNKKLTHFSLKLDNLFDLFNLTQHVNIPTHTAGNTLDYIISSSFTKPSISAESVTFFDHSLVNSSFTIPSFPISHSKVNKRLWSKFNEVFFINSFSQSSFDPLSFSDSNLLLTAFNDSLLESLDAVFLTKTSFCLSSSEAPWFDSQCFSAQRAV